MPFRPLFAAFLLPLASLSCAEFGEVAVDASVEIGMIAAQEAAESKCMEHKVRGCREIAKGVFAFINDEPDEGRELVIQGILKNEASIEMVGKLRMVASAVMTAHDLIADGELSIDLEDALEFAIDRLDRERPRTFREKVGGFMEGVWGN